MDIITDSAVLRDRIAPLHYDRFVALDTEFVRERTYYPLLCLVQVAGERDVFAVDMLAKGLDPAPLYALLDNTAVTKVFHACQQDLEILVERTGKTPAPLFDTQVAARMLGFGEAVSYAALTEELCGVHLDKSSRYTDWSRRPLNPAQLEYAASDVTYLREVYVRLIEQLEARARRSWAEEEMEALRDPNLYRADPEEIWKKIKVRTTSPRFLAVVKALACWREHYARRVDKPRTWILKNEAILEIAAADPRDVKDLTALRSFSSSKQAFCNDILAAVEQGRNAPPVALLKKKSLPAGATPLMDLLKVLLKTQAEQHHVAPSTVADAEDLKEIALHRGEGPLPTIPAMHGWRFDVFGKHALALKEGRLALTADHRKIVLIAPEYATPETAL